MPKLKVFNKPLNVIFLVQIIVIFLAAFGAIDRWWILPMAGMIMVFVLWTDLETSTAFFVRSVPFFVALPLVSYFDSFNLWRVVAGLIFLKWAWRGKLWRKIPLKKTFDFKSHPFVFCFIFFIIFSLLSLLAASDLFGAVKRVIYLVNLSLIGFVICDLVKKRPEFSRELFKSILISAILVAMLGVLQLLSTYLITIYDFMAVWGEQIQLVFYGHDWANIVVRYNTWFAYYGQQLSLRLFSTFPDSHSFPVYMLLAIPSLLAFSLQRVLGRERHSLKKAARIRASPLIVLLPVFYLLIILSGTRGIWLAILSPLVTAPLLWKYLKSMEAKNIFKYLIILLAIFVMLFPVAYPIFNSSQFQVSKGDNALFAKRIRSILSLDEISNHSRLLIWKETLKSIARHPFLGVGIGNYPVVLSQSTEYAKAGSSAHNLYLHIAAEIGLLGLLAALAMLWLIIKRGLVVASDHQDPFIKIYAAGFLIYAIWVLFYNLTDAILFDERAFLIFAINSAIILGLYKNKRPDLVWARCGRLARRNFLLWFWFKFPSQDNLSITLPTRYHIYEICWYNLPSLIKHV